MTWRRPAVKRAARNLSSAWRLDLWWRRVGTLLLQRFGGYHVLQRLFAADRLLLCTRESLRASRSDGAPRRLCHLLWSARLWGFRSGSHRWVYGVAERQL